MAIHASTVQATREILVVDSDLATSAAVRAVVDGGARVRLAADAYQALYDLAEDPVDLVVLELFLPGANGVDVLRRVRARGNRVPVLVLTHARGPFAVLASLGVRHVLHKPASPELLRAAIRDALDSSS